MTREELLKLCNDASDKYFESLVKASSERIGKEINELIKTKGSLDVYDIIPIVQTNSFRFSEGLLVRVLADVLYALQSDRQHD